MSKPQGHSAPGKIRSIENSENAKISNNFFEK
jgi:hypothetical protein